MVEGIELIKPSVPKVFNHLFMDWHSASTPGAERVWGGGVEEWKSISRYSCKKRKTTHKYSNFKARTSQTCFAGNELLPFTFRIDTSLWCKSNCLNFSFVHSAWCIVKRKQPDLIISSNSLLLIPFRANCFCSVLAKCFSINCPVNCCLSFRTFFFFFLKFLFGKTHFHESPQLQLQSLSLPKWRPCEFI